MTLNLFYFLSFVAVFSALLVVFSKNPIYSVLYLIITFFAIAGHYILVLNAQFIGIVHIIVYAGAIMVLFLYVIMLLNLNKEDEPHKSVYLKFAATISAGLFLILFIGSVKGTESMIQDSANPGAIGMVKNLGKVLFTDFLLPFEVASILLLVAMVGAVMLGKSEKQVINKNQ